MTNSIKVALIACMNKLIVHLNVILIADGRRTAPTT
jgi:hypothetical protein